MKEFFADLHIHIGRSEDGSPIKITAARELTFANIVEESLTRKGIDLIGIVDTASPKVIKDIKRLLKTGSLVPLEEGGLIYKEKTAVILGSEVETTEEHGGSTHCLSYFPTLDQIEAFSLAMGSHIKNMTLSTQKARLPMIELFELVNKLGGVMIPAHVFTPHKSVYGNCCWRLGDLLGAGVLEQIPAVELGLSADSGLADRIDELQNKSFLTNSDAHSLPKIGREYNVLELAAVNYQEFIMALNRAKGRRVAANYGLNPRLGKYHRTHCLECDRITEAPPPILGCPSCGSRHIVKGVLDRITEISDFPEPRHPDHRPPYIYQVPLQFLPKVGPKTMAKLLACFGTEMAVLHRAEPELLAEVVGAELAQAIISSRNGAMEVIAGGGGRYGKVATGKHKEA